MTTLRFDSPADLTDSESLGRLLGPVRAVERHVLRTSGFSGAEFEKVEVALGNGTHRTFVLKHVRPAATWTSRITGDLDGREGLLLERPALAPVWEVFANPYVAWARDDGHLALLMQDLAGHLLPDVREPLAEELEARLLGALARLHARFWNLGEEHAAGLAAPETLAGLVLPDRAAEEVARDPSHPVFTRIAEGWRRAEARLSPAAWRLVRAADRVFTAKSEGLPVTLVHGDAKVANFACFPDRRVAAFDWALTSRAPIAAELGYWLAINARRLAGTRDEALVRYREALAEARGEFMDPFEWALTKDLAVVTGAGAMLWSKALNLAGGHDAFAADEWEFYARELDRLASTWQA